MIVKMIDIAREAGVTRQAVSAVFNHPDTCRIPEATQNKIREIATRLGYIPNFAAKVLKGGSSSSIGVFSPQSRFGINTTLLNEIFFQLQKNELDPQVKIIQYSSEHLKQLIREFEMRGMDGIIFCRVDQLTVSSKLPHIRLTDLSTPHSDIGTDLRLGGFMATEHLIGHGRKRIAVLAERKDFCENSLRFAGWRDALIHYGIEYDPELQLYGKKFDFNFDHLVRLLAKLHIDAIFCKNDYIGGKLINELIKRGVKIPDDIAVIGFDGMSFCDFCAVPLATVAQPVCQLASHSVEMLLELIKNKKAVRNDKPIAIPPKFIPNVSCGCRIPPDSRFPHLNTYQTIELERMYNFDENIFASGV